MDTQTITSPSGERLVVLAEAHYIRLVSAAEDGADVAAVDAFNRKLAVGEEELVPAAVANRIMDGETMIKVWREYRGMTSAALAAKAGVDQDVLFRIESGESEGTVDVLRKLSTVLALTIDDLVK